MQQENMKQEYIDQINKELEKIKDRDLLVIVEGKKDRIALGNLGITKIIFLSKTPLYKVIETAAEKAKEVVILTDMDRKGKELYHRLFVGLQKHGVKVNNKLRELLFRAKVSHVEGLDTILFV